MVRWDGTPGFDDDDDEFGRDEGGPTYGCGDDDSDDETDPCPYCSEPVHVTAIYCPKCERYVSREDAPAALRSGWIFWGTVLCLAIAVSWVLLS